MGLCCSGDSQSILLPECFGHPDPSGGFRCQTFFFTLPPKPSVRSLEFLTLCPRHMPQNLRKFGENLSVGLQVVSQLLSKVR